WKSKPRAVEEDDLRGRAAQRLGRRQSPHATADDHDPWNGCHAVAQFTNHAGDRRASVANFCATGQRLVTSPSRFRSSTAASCQPCSTSVRPPAARPQVVAGLRATTSECGTKLWHSAARGGGCVRRTRAQDAGTDRALPLAG